MLRLLARRSVVAAGLLVAAGGCADATSVFQVRSGACVADVSALDGAVTDLDVVDCTDPHDGEVVGVFTHPDAATRPDTVEHDSTVGCARLFEDYLGIAPAVSSLGLAIIDPSEASWAAGDRDSVCLATVGEGEQDIVRRVEGEGEEFIGIHADDPANDQAAIACMTGSFTACDTLYVDAPPDSTEELIAATCGGRIESDEIDDPGHCELTLGG